MKKYLFNVVVFVTAIFLTACGGGSSVTTIPNSCLDDMISSVNTGDGCIELLSSRVVDDPRILWVIIHGDGSSGGASDATYNALADLASNDSMALGMIRPGYFTADNRTSTGPDSDRRFDHYTEAVTNTLAAGLTKLKAHYDPDELIVVGHSGGAALTSLIASFNPTLIDRTVLVSCPCNIPEWRVFRSGTDTWTRSLSPHDYVNQLNTQAPLVAVVGENDTNTYPQLSIDYADLALIAGVTKASSEVLANTDHNGIIISDAQPLINFIIQWVNN